MVSEWRFEMLYYYYQKELFTIKIRTNTSLYYTVDLSALLPYPTRLNAERHFRHLLIGT
jgi:hypothetical protein